MNPPVTCRDIALSLRQCCESNTLSLFPSPINPSFLFLCLCICFLFFFSLPIVLSSMLSRSTEREIVVVLWIVILSIVIATGRLKRRCVPYECFAFLVFLHHFGMDRFVIVIIRLFVWLILHATYMKGLACLVVTYCCCWTGAMAFKYSLRLRAMCHFLV